MKDDMLLLTFDFICPSGWKWKSRRSGWKKLMGWNRKFDKALQGYHLVKKLHAKGKRKVSIIRYSPKKKFIKDYCNLVEGHKPLLDALVRAKLLVDDSMKYLEESYQQIECNEEKTEVLIWLK